MFRILILLAGAGSLMANTDIPTVEFCDLARNPQAYFGKTVRLTAVYEQWTEGAYLTDQRCPLSPDDRVGVAWFPADEKQRKAVQDAVSQIGSPKYSGKAIVTIVGTLCNEKARHFVWYGSRFDIASFESVRPVKSKGISKKE